jgi:hypothetical protein
MRILTAIVVVGLLLAACSVAGASSIYVLVPGAKSDLGGIPVCICPNEVATCYCGVANNSPARGLSSWLRELPTYAGEDDEYIYCWGRNEVGPGGRCIINVMQPGSWKAALSKDWCGR